MGMCAQKSSVNPQLDPEEEIYREEAQQYLYTMSEWKSTN